MDRPASPSALLWTPHCRRLRERVTRTACAQPHRFRSRGAFFRNIILDSPPIREYVAFMFSFERWEKCVSGRVDTAVAGGCWFLRMRGRCTKNVYFCFWEKKSYIKVLRGFYVYFCIPARKGRSRKIKGLVEKMSTFAYF